MLPFPCWLTGCVLDDPVFCQTNHRKQKYKNGVAFNLVSSPPLLLPILLTLWQTTVTICLWTNQPAAIVLYSPVQQHHLLPAPCPITSGKHLFHHLTLVPWHPVIDWLAIGNLAKDFQLEPMQRANLHAFSGVGSLSCSTCVQYWSIIVRDWNVGWHTGKIWSPYLHLHTHIHICWYHWMPSPV